MATGRGVILLTGVNGQVGGALLPMLQSVGEVVVPTRAELDLLDAAAVRQFVRDVQPRWIVNPAAYTAVDKAESEPERAFAINAEAVGILGDEAARLGAAMVHFSTDYVFAGDGAKPWTEKDATGPQGVYGASKLEGERVLAASGAAHLTFRTSWVYGATGNNFLRTILRLAGERSELKIVADQHGAPTWSHELAKLTVHCMEWAERESAEKKVSVVEALRPVSGVYHACGAGETTWFGFAERFVQMAREAEPEKRFATLMPIATEEYPTAAKRPANSRLSCSKLAKTFGYALPRWEDSLTEVMLELEEQQR